MHELCLSSISNKIATQFSTLLSDLFLFLSLILSHPLYFAYFIFFSPYLLKVLSFLSPLFITTALLLLGFLTVSPTELSESQMGFLLSMHYRVGESFWSNTENEDKEFHHFEEFEAYKIIFDTSVVLCALENSVEVLELRSDVNLEEKTVEIAWEEKRIEGLVKELDEFENTTLHKKEKIEVPGIKSVEVKKEGSLVRSKSEAMGDKLKNNTVKASTDNGGEDIWDKPLESPSSRTFHSNLGSHRSMRKDREWKRTLACKIFEERHNVGGAEGMDSLWETYEIDSSNKAKPKGTNKKKMNKTKREYIGEDDYEDEDVDGQLCCLHAFKFSSGKMNFGMRRPSLVKISKAIKGIGWLQKG